MGGGSRWHANKKSLSCLVTLIAILNCVCETRKYLIRLAYKTVLLHNFVGKCLRRERQITPTRKGNDGGQGNERIGYHRVLSWTIC